MQLKRAKAMMVCVLLLFTFFFSNDFGLIDVEKTSIVTAITIDYEDEKYLITAQVAVPEATDTNTENQKAQLSGKGNTVGQAIKDLGDLSGWFPKLAFCNLIILGNGLKDQNVVKILDYFAKTLRLQDSALVALADKNAKEILSLSTPLDNISSFAIQKILFKASGFDNDVARTDIKTFCSGYYSDNSSGYMPIIKIVSADSGSGNEGEKTDNSSSSSGGKNQTSQGSNSDSNNLFDARSTALFKNGKMVGELSPELTVAFNAINTSITGTSLAVKDVPYKDKQCNYLINVLNDKNSIKVKATDTDVELNISLSLFCKVSDVDATYNSESLSANLPLSKPLIQKTKELLVNSITELVNTSVKTDCDFLKIKEKLYRFNYSKYSLYKDNFLSKLKVKINADVRGQR